MKDINNHDLKLIRDSNASCLNDAEFSQLLKLINLLGLKNPVFGAWAHKSKVTDKPEIYINHNFLYSAAASHPDFKARYVYPIYENDEYNIDGSKVSWAPNFNNRGKLAFIYYVIEINSSITDLCSTLDLRDNTVMAREGVDIWNNEQVFNKLMSREKLNILSSASMPVVFSGWETEGYKNVCEAQALSKFLPEKIRNLLILEKDYLEYDHEYTFPQEAWGWRVSRDILETI